MDIHEDKMQEKKVELGIGKSNVCEGVEEEFAEVSRRKRERVEMPPKEKENDNTNTRQIILKKTRKTTNKNSLRTPMPKPEHENITKAKTHRVYQVQRSLVQDI